jgi:hypothetical protein
MNNADRCAACGGICSPHVIRIERRHERLTFLEAPEVVTDVESAETLAAFCSGDCAKSLRETVMRKEAIPTAHLPPTAEPTQICGFCHGLVDLSKCYLVYVEAEEEQGGMQQAARTNLAVVCSRCESLSTQTGFTEHDLPDHGRPLTVDDVYKSEEGYER